MYDHRETMSGVVGAFCNVYAGLPFDVAKVRLQTQTIPAEYNGVTDCMTKIVRQEGLRSLWKGAIPALSSAIMENAVLFSANGILRRVIFAQETSLRTIDEALLGSAAAIFSATAITPAEVIKCRLQSDHGTKSLGVRHCIEMVVQENGLRGLMAGLPAVLLRDVPFNFCFFGAYDAYTSLILQYQEKESKRELHPLAVLAAGGFAGATGWSIVFPVDVVKSRMQVGNNVSFRKAALGVWNQHGIHGFFRGWSAAVLRSFPANGCLFLGVEMTHRLFHYLDDASASSITV
ncbi:Mitochondrial Carrier (MC) Family [Thraustotheca clavata]|uniref:Mitochondrial Carrier (MC) Family n=1 Tax=Thraustotheca clavata TaxID=74557 RepID=A0A1V9ZVS5_9STRA|nr:Mitochondrial Carrier (MC) Family [Thraustotheca clavata]